MIRCEARISAHVADGNRLWIARRFGALSEADLKLYQMNQYLQWVVRDAGGLFGAGRILKPLASSARLTVLAVHALCKVVGVVRAFPPILPARRLGAGPCRLRSVCKRTESQQRDRLSAGIKFLSGGKFGGNGCGLRTILLPKRGADPVSLPGKTTDISPMLRSERYRSFMALQTGDEEDRIRLASYTAAISPIGPESLPLLHELAVSVFWPHRARDIAVFLSLGQGYLACDEIGRPLGSAMYFPMGEDFAMCGMLIVPPRLQAQGVGKRLLKRIMRDCGERDLRVTSTHSGDRLYESAGFVSVGDIAQHQGLSKPVDMPQPAPEAHLRPLDEADLPALLALDAHAYGADRSAMFAELLKTSDGRVIEVAGEIRGFALSRRFGKGVVIGPLVAEDDAMAIQLAAPFVQANAGRFTRVDTSCRNVRFRAFLSAAGLGVFDTVKEMSLGPHRRSSEGAQVYGMASHSLG